MYQTNRQYPEEREMARTVNLSQSLQTRVAKRVGRAF